MSAHSETYPSSPGELPLGGLGPTESPEDALREISAAAALKRMRRQRHRRPPLAKRAWVAARARLASARAGLASLRTGTRGFAADLITATPAWLVSMLIHLSLMLLLGLVAVEAKREEGAEMAVDLAAVEDLDQEIYAETLGHQLENPTPGLTAEDLSGDATSYAISDLPEVDDPLAAPTPSLDMSGEGSEFYSDIESPAIGMALTGRQKGRKDALMAAYGGTKTTQESVTLALAWIGRQQQNDGLWSLSGPYSDGSHSENQLAATAMAMLALLGDGHTHLEEGPHRREMHRAVNALLKLQGPEGEFLPEEAPSTHRLYTHAQCTIVLCELYGITDDSRVREAASRAIEYCVKIQSAEGGWRYYPGEDSDMSVTGWFAMALQSARMAKLEVPTPAFSRLGRFLDSVASHGGSRYSYLPGRVETQTMTAEALLCRQYLGWKRDDERLVKGVAYIGQQPVDWNNRNVYYWYYATQVTHHMGREPWVAWNRVMRQTIPENQIRAGRERGSWNPDGDQWVASAGRLCMTCMCTYMLEVYYRHLPLYGTDVTLDMTTNE